MESGSEDEHVDEGLRPPLQGQRRRSYNVLSPRSPRAGMCDGNRMGWMEVCMYVGMGRKGRRDYGDVFFLCDEKRSGSLMIAWGARRRMSKNMTGQKVDERGGFGSLVQAGTWLWYLQGIIWCWKSFHRSILAMIMLICGFCCEFMNMVVEFLSEMIIVCRNLNLAKMNLLSDSLPWRPVQKGRGSKFKKSPIFIIRAKPAVDFDDHKWAVTYEKKNPYPAWPAGFRVNKQPKVTHVLKSFSMCGRRKNEISRTGRHWYNMLFILA